jgi:hypothetical protein
VVTGALVYDGGSEASTIDLQFGVLADLGSTPLRVAEASDTGWKENWASWRLSILPIPLNKEIRSCETHPSQW